MAFGVRILSWMFYGHVNGDVEGANGAALLGPKNQ